MAILDSFKKLFSTNRRKKVMTVSAAGVVIVAVVVSFLCITAASNGNTAPTVVSTPKKSSSIPFAAAPAISEPALQGVSSSSNSLSVDVGKPKTSSTPTATATSSSTTVSKHVISTPIKTQSVEKSSTVAIAAPPKTTTEKPASTQKPASSPYASYTRLDMTNFDIGKAVYADDVSVAARFANSVANSSNIPKTSFGAPIVDLGGPSQLYAFGEVSIDNLRSVLINGHHYIGGGESKYIITGVYDNSKGITYDRTNMSTVISQVDAKGFVNNPYSGTTSYSGGYLCTKISDGGSTAKTGYVRAVVFTLKKIS